MMTTSNKTVEPILAPGFTLCPALISKVGMKVAVEDVIFEKELRPGPRIGNKRIGE